MADLVRKRRPIAGGLWGISLGLGLALLAINSKIISLSIPSIVMVVVLGIIVGIAWGMFGPAKKPKGPEPTSSAVPADPTSAPPESPPTEPVAAPPSAAADVEGDGRDGSQPDGTDPGEAGDD